MGLQECILLLASWPLYTCGDMLDHQPLPRGHVKSCLVHCASVVDVKGQPDFERAPSRVYVAHQQRAGRWVNDGGVHVGCAVNVGVHRRRAIDIGCDVPVTGNGVLATVTGMAGIVGAAAASLRCTFCALPVPVLITISKVPRTTRPTDSERIFLSGLIGRLPPYPFMRKKGHISLMPEKKSCGNDFLSSVIGRS